MSLFFNLGPHELFLALIASGIFLIPFILYLVTLQNALKQVTIENREISPALVWLTLIPVFGIVWQLYIIVKISQSLKAEFKARDFYIDEQYPGLYLGIAFVILFCLSFFPLPFVPISAGTACLITWILYWVKINNYRQILKWR